MRYLFQCVHGSFFSSLFFYWISLFISFHSKYDFIYYYDYLLFTVCHHRIAPYFRVVRVKRLILFVPSSLALGRSYFSGSIVLIFNITLYQMMKRSAMIWCAYNLLLLFDCAFVCIGYLLVVDAGSVDMPLHSFRVGFFLSLSVRVCWITIIKIFIFVL